MIFEEPTPSRYDVDNRRSRRAVATLYSPGQMAKALHVEFRELTMVRMVLESDESAVAGDLIVCQPPFQSGLAIQGLYDVVCVTRVSESRCRIVADLLSLQPSEELIRLRMKPKAAVPQQKLAS